MIVPRNLEYDDDVIHERSPRFSMHISFVRETDFAVTYAKHNSLIKLITQLERATKKQKKNISSW